MIKMPLIMLNFIENFAHFRWTHYFKRYSLHMKSLKYEEKLTDDQIKIKMDDMQAMGKTWNEVCI